MSVNNIKLSFSSIRASLDQHGSEGDCLPSIWEALDSIPSTIYTPKPKYKMSPVEYK